MKELILNVEGMVCNGCENRVKNAVESIDGVESATADYKSGIVTIILNQEIEESKLEEKIEDIGFTVVKDS